MKSVSFVVALVGIGVCFAVAQSNRDSKRSISLKIGTAEVVVPAGRLWKIEGLDPYKSDKRNRYRRLVY